MVGLTCNLQSPPAGVSKQRGSMPAVPILKPLGASARNLASKLPTPRRFLNTDQPEQAVKFYRPDVPPESGDDDDSLRQVVTERLQQASDQVIRFVQERTDKSSKPPPAAEA